MHLVRGLRAGAPLTLLHVIEIISHAYFDNFVCLLHRAPEEPITSLWFCLDWSELIELMSLHYKNINTSLRTQGVTCHLWHGFLCAPTTFVATSFETPMLWPLVMSLQGCPSFWINYSVIQLAINHGNFLSHWDIAVDVTSTVSAVTCLSLW